MILFDSIAEHEQPIRLNFFLGIQTTTIIWKVSTYAISHLERDQNPEQKHEK